MLVLILYTSHHSFGKESTYIIRSVISSSGYSSLPRSYKPAQKSGSNGSSTISSATRKKYTSPLMMNSSYSSKNSSSNYDSGFYGSNYPSPSLGSSYHGSGSAAYYSNTSTSTGGRNSRNPARSYGGTNSGSSLYSDPGQKSRRPSVDLSSYKRPVRPNSCYDSSLTDNTGSFSCPCFLI